jgi:hypothetical protein
VKQAYYGLLRPGATGGRRRDLIKQFEKQLEQARGFFEAGVRPVFDA